MRWLVFCLFAYVSVTLDLGLHLLLRIDTSSGPVCPSIVFVLAIFIATWAQPLTAYWACLILGIMVDLRGGVFEPDQKTVVVLIGPCALGYLLAGFATMQIRPMFYRASPFSIAGIALFSGTLAQLLTIAIITFRTLFNQGIANWVVADELYLAFLRLMYTVALAVPLGWCLTRSLPLWGFASPKAVGAYGRKVIGGE